MGRGDSSGAPRRHFDSSLKMTSSFPACLLLWILRPPERPPHPPGLGDFCPSPTLSLTHQKLIVHQLREMANRGPSWKPVGGATPPGNPEQPSTFDFVPAETQCSLVTERPHSRAFTQPFALLSLEPGCQVLPSLQTLAQGALLPSLNCPGWQNGGERIRK